MPEFLETMVDKFIFRAATDRLYSRDGVWLQAAGPGRARLGATDYFQQRGGDVAFAHVKAAGTALRAGDELAEIETIKANNSLFTPVAGTVADVNPALDLFPETINEDPYGKGWVAVLESPDWESEAAKLLDAEQYLAWVRAEAEKELAG